MTAIPPGSTIGILGAGQLGRMLAIAARTLGYGIAVLGPEQPSPAGAVADRQVVAGYDDSDAIAGFAAGVDVLTFEFENIASAAVAAATEHTLVRPGERALHITQHRLREKTFLQDIGIPCAPWRAVDSAAGLDAALAELGQPAVLKTAGFGYDGKGQVLVSGDPSLVEARAQAERTPCVLEGFVDFSGEVSVVLARGAAGEIADYGVIENHHRHHILDVSMAPAPLPPPVWHEAVALAGRIAAGLDYVGVLCVELFVTSEGALLVNEIAPRVHNSGHLTGDACVTGQFEQHIRAICGLPLGSTRYRQPAAMANLLGDLWEPGPPRWQEALAMADVRLHLYGKGEPRPGRKMGHLTALADDPQAALELVRTARRVLRSVQGPVA